MQVNCEVTMQTRGSTPLCKIKVLMTARICFTHACSQSINQSNFSSANMPGVARLSGATARSVFKYKVVEAIL